MQCNSPRKTRLEGRKAKRIRLACSTAERDKAWSPPWRRDRVCRWDWLRWRSCVFSSFDSIGKICHWYNFSQILLTDGKASLFWLKCPKTDQKRTKNRPKTDQKQTKNRPNRTNNGPKTDQKRTKNRPNRTNNGPKTDQKGPKRDQIGPNRD